ncbi:hypothetical protein ACFQ9V_13240 [Leifsonia sp. NPDC056665]|uniref:hypothetical protein n=1 Tax=Leifsonia sp. NPDC056665 TaxID=3345901 RepID=UPI0036B8D2DD
MPPTRPSDLYDYEEPLPAPWAQSIQEIESAGANRNHVEAEKLRIQIALSIQRANTELFVNDEANRRARAEEALQRELADQQTKAAADERSAAETRAAASDRIARSLTVATWVLAGATIALVITTVALAVFGR